MIHLISLILIFYVQNGEFKFEKDYMKALMNLEANNERELNRLVLKFNNPEGNGYYERGGEQETAWLNKYDNELGLDIDVSGYSKPTTPKVITTEIWDYSINLIEDIMSNSDDKIKYDYGSKLTSRQAVGQSNGNKNLRNEPTSDKINSNHLNFRAPNDLKLTMSDLTETLIGEKYEEDGTKPELFLNTIDLTGYWNVIRNDRISHKTKKKQRHKNKSHNRSSVIHDRHPRYNKETLNHKPMSFKTRINSAFNKMKIIGKQKIFENTISWAPVEIVNTTLKPKQYTDFQKAILAEQIYSKFENNTRKKNSTKPKDVPWKVDLQITHPHRTNITVKTTKKDYFKSIKKAPNSIKETISDSDLAELLLSSTVRTRDFKIEHLKQINEDTMPTSKSTPDIVKKLKEIFISMSSSIENVITTELPLEVHEHSRTRNILNNKGILSMWVDNGWPKKNLKGHNIIKNNIGPLDMWQEVKKDYRKMYRQDEENTHAESTICKPAHRYENTDIRDQLYTTVRVVCIVLTNASEHETKAFHIRNTWGKKCNKLLFMSTDIDKTFPTVLLQSKTGDQWDKTMKSYQHVLQYYYNEADWILKADDDSYLIMENLRYMLSYYKSSDALFIGCEVKNKTTSYMYGGAGYVLSKEALYRLINIGLQTRPPICNVAASDLEDIQLANCLRKLGVQFVDTRDSIRQYQFFPFKVQGSLNNQTGNQTGLRLPEINLQKNGPGCCSDFTISLNKLTPSDMYGAEFFIYHLRPFGVNYVNNDVPDILRGSANMEITTDNILVEYKPDSDENIVDSFFFKSRHLIGLS